MRQRQLPTSTRALRLESVVGEVTCGHDVRVREASGRSDGTVAPFAEIFGRAAARKSAALVLESVPATAASLLSRETPATQNGWILARMARCALYAGFSSKVTDGKRQAFEKDIDLNANTFMVEAHSDRLMRQAGALRNGAKIKSAQVNAQSLSTLKAKHGRAARLFADRPGDVIIKMAMICDSLRRHCVRGKK